MEPLRLLGVALHRQGSERGGEGSRKEIGDMVDLDSDPTKLIELVAIDEQLPYDTRRLPLFRSPTMS